MDDIVLASANAVHTDAIVSDDKDPVSLAAYGSIPILRVSDAILRVSNVSSQLHIDSYINFFTNI